VSPARTAAPKAPRHTIASVYPPRKGPD
jgi:hypothetical protein